MGREVPWGDGTLYSNRGGGYTTVCICQHLQNSTLKRVHFNVVTWYVDKNVYFLLRIYCM